MCVCPSLYLFRFYLLSVSPGGDIYQTSGGRPSLSTGLDQIYLRLSPLFSALCLERSEDTEGCRGNFLQNSPSSAVKGYLRWRGWGIPYRTYPSFFYLCINLVPAQEQCTWKTSPWPWEGKQLRCTQDRGQLGTNCAILLFKWIILTPLLCLLPLFMSLICPSLSLSLTLPPPTSLSHNFSLQSSASVEGPEWSRGPSASSLTSPVTWRRRVPDGA